MPGLTEAQEIHIIQKLILECSNCQKFTKFHDRKKGGSRCQHKWFTDPKTATLAVQQWNANEHSPGGGQP